MTTQYAGFLRRFLAFWIDTFILSLGLILLQAILGLEPNFGLKAKPMPPLTPSLIGFNILSLTCVWLYYALLESSSWQATLGKRLLKIKVTNLHGNRISFLRATGRYFAKFLSTLILFIGYLMVIFTEKKQGLHDIIAETLVVRE